MSVPSLSKTTRSIASRSGERDTDRPPVKQQIGRRDARRPILISGLSGYWPIQAFHFASFASAHFLPASSWVMPALM